MTPKPMTPAMRAEAFQFNIPAHLKGDAMLQNVTEQLAMGGSFSAHSMAYIKMYIRTTVRPMTPDEFAEAMKQALSWASRSN